MVSVISITASAILYYRAETIRWVTFDDWTRSGAADDAAVTGEVAGGAVEPA